MDKQSDILIIGGGIIGLSTTWQLLSKYPHLRILLLEKEKQLAAHQTGHNSGVIHSGIYYRPGSLKAKNCISGVNALKEFCNNYTIPFKKTGKLIIATEKEELPRLYELERRGKANGVKDLSIINASHLKDLEPQVSGIKALYSPHVSIINFSIVAKKLSQLFESLGGQILLSQEVNNISRNRNEIIVKTKTHEYKTSYLINCAGIYSDRIARLLDNTIGSRKIFPFRGEYYFLAKEKSDIIQHLIYPVPDPKFPFLGVHLTKTMDGSIEAGPNAVLAFSREGYKKTDVCLQDCFDYLKYPGFWLMVRRYWWTGMHELYRSLSKKAFLKALQRLVPSLTKNDLIQGGSGVRSQVVEKNGKLVDDFVIEKGNRSIHVLNAPSPGATASLTIGSHIVQLAEESFALR